MPGTGAVLITFPEGGAYAATKHAVVAVAEQAALALADSPVTLTLLCPALVRSGMFELGEDPHDVAATALAAAEQRRFLVVPREWTGAVRHRNDMLLSGSAPTRQSASTASSSVPARNSKIHGDGAEKVTTLDVGRATLELSNLCAGLDDRRARAPLRLVSRWGPHQVAELRPDGLLPLCGEAHVAALIEGPSTSGTVGRAA